MAQTANSTLASRRRFLLSAPAAAVATAHVAAPDIIDPVFRLIAHEAKAYRLLDAACTATDDVVLGRDTTPEEDAMYLKASNQAERALSVVCASKPKTPAGLIAVLDLFEERDAENVPEPIRSNLAGIFEATRSLLTG